MPTFAHMEANASHALINNHVGMALKMARRLATRLPASVSREDVESAALLGLTEAARRYDESRSEPFMAFASKRVRGAILDHLRRIDQMSRRGRHDARRVNDAIHRLENEYGRPVTEAEVAEELGLSEDEVRMTFSDLRAVNTVPLEDFEALSTSASIETPVECIERQQMRTALVRALETLEQRSLMVMALYYQEGLTLREIGELLGVTESRVCQMHTQALQILRKQLV